MNHHKRFFCIILGYTGPFFVKKIFPHDAREIENPKNGNIFKVNGK